MRAEKYRKEKLVLKNCDRTSIKEPIILPPAFTMPKKWTTPEQEKFLEGYIPEYFKGRDNDDLPSVFWPLINSEWFRAFPEKSALFPGVDKLTVEQEDELGVALEKRKQVSLCTVHHKTLLTEKYAS
jgi:hypothetical protein